MMATIRNWNEKYLLNLQSQGKIKGFKIMNPINPDDENAAVKSKFNSERTMVEEKEFHSKKEAKRYTALNLLLKKGVIGMLARQVEFELNVGGTHSLKYIADFTYRIMATGEFIVEDTKGIRTVSYKKKRKLMKKLYQIEIKET